LHKYYSSTTNDSRISYTIKDKTVR
jgi:hypothetical protein